MSISNSFDLENDNALRRTFYIAGWLLILMPVVQGFSQAWPLRFGNVEWRFGATNLFTGLLMVPYVGLCIVLAIAKYCEQKNIVRLVGFFAAFCTIVLVGGDLLYVLDALQLKAIVKTQEMARFNRGVMQNGFTAVMYTVVFALYSLAALRGSKSEPKVVAKGSRKVVSDDSPGLLIGQDYDK